LDADLDKRALRVLGEAAFSMLVGAMEKSAREIMHTLHHVIEESTEPKDARGQKPGTMRIVYAVLRWCVLDANSRHDMC
jgi:hypothetical protein